MKEAKDFDPFRLFLTLYYWSHVMQRRYSDCAKFWDDQKQGSHADEGPSLNFTRFQSCNSSHVQQRSKEKFLEMITVIKVRSYFCNNSSQGRLENQVPKNSSIILVQIRATHLRKRKENRFSSLNIFNTILPSRINSQNSLLIIDTQ